MSKLPKTPKINSATKILCFDLETNGLHGQAFAIGAVVMDPMGKVHEEFTARSPVVGDMDGWVRENVLPSIANMQQSHDSYQAMREAFWEWYLLAEPKSDYVLVKNGYPVEYRFLLDCQEASLKERYWQHPFPIIDLTSLLLPLGQLDEATKNKLQSRISKEYNLRAHNPLDDAKATALIAFEALQNSENIL